MQGREAVLAAIIGVSMVGGGLRLLRPAAAPEAPASITTWAWVFPGEDPSRPWTRGAIARGHARIALVVRDAATGERVSANSSLDTPDNALRQGQRGGIGPWWWDVALGTQLVLRVSAGGYHSATGVVELPAVEGGVLGTTVWLVPFATVLNGQVVGPDGRPVSGATVALELPARGGGSPALMAYRMRVNPLSVMRWQDHIANGLQWVALTDAQGYWSLSALPGQRVRIVARSMAYGAPHSAETMAVATSGARPLPPLVLNRGDVKLPAAPVAPRPHVPVLPAGRVAVGVRLPHGTVIAGDVGVTLAQGRSVLESIELRDGWAEVAAPSRQQLELHLLPAAGDGLSLRTVRVRLQPDDRLWLGVLKLRRRAAPR